MSYVLQDGKGKKIACYSSCLDITYAQAELLLMAEQAKRDHPDCFIAGFCDTKMQLSVDRFLEPHRAAPADLKKIEDYRAQIKEKGIAAFSSREYMGEMESIGKDGRILVGKAIDPFVTQMAQLRQEGETGDLALLVEDIYANPLHAGIHHGFTASVLEETWVADAARSMKRIGSEKWLRRMLQILRFYLKGKPLLPLPHKNDRCPCGSSRKYGKCCGQGIELEDPEDCKLGKHQVSAWEEVQASSGSIKLIRNCDRCFRIFEPPWFEELEVDGCSVLMVGCRACSSRATLEEMKREINLARKWNVCPCCSVPFEIERIVLEHAWQDGKHMESWSATEIISKDDQVDLQSVGLGKGVFLHKECFMKALPAWPKVAKTSSDSEPVEIMRKDIDLVP